MWSPWFAAGFSFGVASVCSVLLAAAVSVLIRAVGGLGLNNAKPLAEAIKAGATRSWMLRRRESELFYKRNATRRNHAEPEARLGDDIKLEDSECAMSCLILREGGWVGV